MQPTGRDMTRRRRTSNLRCIGRAEDSHVGHAAQAHEHLHRLVGGAVLTQTDAVVREPGWRSGQRAHRC